MGGAQAISPAPPACLLVLPVLFFLIPEGGSARGFADHLAARTDLDPNRIALGIDGLEVDHRDNPMEDQRQLADLVEERGLVRTGSSDYHGSGKINRLGENTTSPQMLDKIAHKASLEVIRP